MRRLPQNLVAAQLELAEHLVDIGGRPMLRQIALRRAVSGAYYAIFHALCAVCADELVGWARTGTLDPIYRTLDHRTVRRRLMSVKAATIAPSSIQKIAASFAHLQDQRHAADYEPPKLLFSPRQVRLLVDEAREAINLIEALPARGERLRLAIFLIAHDRAL